MFPGLVGVSGVHDELHPKFKPDTSDSADPIGGSYGSIRRSEVESSHLSGDIRSRF